MNLSSSLYVTVTLSFLVLGTSWSPNKFVFLSALLTNLGVVYNVYCTPARHFSIVIMLFSFATFFTAERWTPSVPLEIVPFGLVYFAYLVGPLIYLKQVTPVTPVPPAPTSPAEVLVEHMVLRPLRQETTGSEDYEQVTPTA